MVGIAIHRTTLASDLVPAPGAARPTWWAEDPRTEGHAEHCLPLLMANRLGYVVRSPGSFEVSWEGGWNDQATVTVLDDSDITVDAHSCGASFTLQPGFLASTTEVDAFLHVRPVANQRGVPFSAMEALIEAWWQPGEFGIVCLLHRPETFVVERGDPVAQISVYLAGGGAAELEVTDTLPMETDGWRARRYRPGYVKDLDYFRGRHPDGAFERSHRTSWRSVTT